VAVKIQLNYAISRIYDQSSKQNKSYWSKQAQAMLVTATIACIIRQRYRRTEHRFL